MSPRIAVLARCLGLSVLCLGLSLGCTEPGISPQPPPEVEGVVDAAASTVTVDRPTGVLANGDDVAVVTVTALRKADGSRLSGRAVSVTVEGEAASVLESAAITDSNGMAQARVESTVPGVKTVKASVMDDTGKRVPLTQAATVEFVDVRTVKTLAFRSALPDGVAGVPIEGLVVEVRDGSGAVVADSTAEVTLSLGSGGIVFPEGLLTVAAVNGVATFPDVVLERAGANYHFIANAPGFEPAASTFFKVLPGPVAALGVDRFLDDATAGVAQDQEVTLADRYSNTVTTYTGTVTLTSTDAAATLPSHTFTAADAGRFTFQGITFRTAGSQVLTLKDSAGAFSFDFPVNVAAALPTHMVFTQQPASPVSTRASLGTVKVELKDPFGNTSRVSGIMVHVSVPAGAFTLSGGPQQWADDGIATFPDLSIAGHGTTHLIASVAPLQLQDVNSEDVVVSDTQAPAAAAGFSATAVSSDGIRLDWQAPGDDGVLGTAKRYELRQATSAITDATFDSATLVTGVGAPKTAGTAESFTVTELTASTTYHFALKAFDGAGNASALATASAPTASLCDGHVCTPPASQCAEDGTSLEVYASVCVVRNGAPTCEDGETTLQACPGADAVCYAGACTTAPHPGAGELVLSEVMHSPSAGTTEYLELTNTTSKLLDANGLVVNLVDGAGTASTLTVNHGHALLVPAGGRTVLAQDANFTRNGGVAANHAWGTDLSLDNTGSITLKQGAVTVDSLTYTSAFPRTEGRAMSLASSIVGTKGSAQSWYWCDSTGSLSGGDRGTPGQANDDCGQTVDKPLFSCIVYYPKTFPSPDGVYPEFISTTDSYDILSRFESHDVTTRNEQGNDFYPFIEAQVGYGTDTTNPAGWTWIPADFNAQYSISGSWSDEMKAPLRIPTPGTYSYGFRYRFTDPGAPWEYCDRDGKTVPPLGRYGSVLVAKEPLTNHVVISEFSGGKGSGLTDEFIELYNPTNKDVDLSGWQVSYKPATGAWDPASAVTIPEGYVIPAHGYFLLGGANFTGDGTSLTDLSYTFDATASTTGGGHIRVQRPVTGPEGTTYVDVDTLGFGAGDSPEGTAAPAHPEAGGSLERKAVASSDSTTMAAGGTDAARGNGQDTDNNGVDFVPRATRQPQGTTSALEYH
ncbi:lamin tail domain-containing protein [Corallococcus exercitus]|uniref:lamin tail domain-containing protein n=1 Tax=Corallococcus exercitus TaxID=2316736 RepID=UPI0035D40563